MVGPNTVLSIVITPADNDSLPDGWKLVEEESVSEAEGPVMLEHTTVLRGRIRTSWKKQFRSEMSLLTDLAKAIYGQMTQPELNRYIESWRRVSGKELLKQAEKVGNRAGIRAARAVARLGNQLPADWLRETRLCLVFPGTVAESQNGRRYIPVVSCMRDTLGLAERLYNFAVSWDPINDAEIDEYYGHCRLIHYANIPGPS